MSNSSKNMNERPQHPIVCRVCGTENRVNRLFCSECGSYLQDEEEDTLVEFPPPSTPATLPLPSPPPFAPPTPPPLDPPRATYDPGGPYESEATYESGGPYDPEFPRGYRRVDAERRWGMTPVLLALLLVVAVLGMAAVVYFTMIRTPEGTSSVSTTGQAGTGTTTTVGSTTTGDATTSTTGTDSRSSTTTSSRPTEDPGTPLGAVPVSASSALPPEGGNDYRPQNLVDGDLSTCWAEGVSGQGEGEWVRLDLGEPTMLSTIEIANGYQKDQRRFEGNPRLKTIRIEYSDGSAQLIQMHDDGGYQAITPPPIATEWVRLVIQATYPGATWPDTSISEVRLYRAGR